MGGWGGWWAVSSRQGLLLCIREGGWSVPGVSEVLSD